MHRQVIPWGLIKIDVLLLICKLIGSFLNNIISSIDIGIPLIGGFLTGAAQLPFKIVAFVPNMLGKLFWPFFIITIVLIIIRIIANKRAKQKMQQEIKEQVAQVSTVPTDTRGKSIDDLNAF